MDVLSRILEDLNERFSTDFTDDDRVSIRAREETLAGDRALAASLRANTRENARLTFEPVANDRLQGLVESNFKLYKKISDDPEFSKYFLDLLFERLLKGVE